MKYFLSQEGQLSVSVERMCTILVNRLEDLAYPVNVWLGKLTALDMTPLGYWAVKPQHKQINEQPQHNTFIQKTSKKKKKKKKKSNTHQ